MRFKLLAVSLMLLAGLVMLPRGSDATTLTMWSSWASQPAKKNFLEGVIHKFEHTHPGATIKITWYNKMALYSALETALRAGQGPDIFYAEPNQKQYMTSGLILNLAHKVHWNNMEPWAKRVWSYKGGVYGFPLEAWTVELYYNKSLLHKLGVTLPANLQFSQQQFIALVKKARRSGITPISLGVGDRPYPGAFLTEEALLKSLGVHKYTELLEGKISWNNPKVRHALTFVKELVNAGALPKTFNTLKLAESHYYFYGKPGSLMFLMGSFYPTRAFNPPDQGGQPKDFPLGIMHYPAVKGESCQYCKTLAVGGSYVINSASTHKKLAVAFLNSMANPRVGKTWVKDTLVQTGIKTSLSNVSGPHADYFKMLGRVDSKCKFFFGLPDQVMTGKPKEVFTQVINQAFPAGLLSVKQVIHKMDAAYK